MSRVLIVAALIAAVVLTLLGFGIVTATDPHLFGWVGLTFGFYVAADLVP